MNILRLTGGLGNQMYQYAFAKELEYRGHKVQFDCTYFDMPDDVFGVVAHRRYGLDCFPAIQIERASEKSIQQKSSPCRLFLRKVQRKIPFLRLPCSQYVEREFFSEDAFSNKNAYMEGFWQSQAYFPHVRQSLRNDFRFKQPSDDRNIQTLEKMQSGQSVSVHIRRGDYLAMPDIYGGVCDDKYYQRALEKMEQSVPDADYYFFSDDPEWVSDNFHMGNQTVVDWNTGDESWIDMLLMSRCKHNIIANSSFSWWGAWLNENPDRIVISPAYCEKRKEISAEKRVEGWNYLT